MVLFYVRTELQALLYGCVDVNYCVSDDFVRNRSKQGIEKVTAWIKRSGYDRTRPLRAEVALAAGSVDFFY